MANFIRIGRLIINVDQICAVARSQTADEVVIFITGKGPRDTGHFVVSGADARSTLNAGPLDGWRTYRASAGAILRLGEVRHGVRVYLCVEGGIDALEDLVTSLKRGTETRLSIVVDAMFPTASLVAFAQDFAREHPGVELVLFTEVLSAVTSPRRSGAGSPGS